MMKTQKQLKQNSYNFWGASTVLRNLPDSTEKTRLQDCILVKSSYMADDRLFPEICQRIDTLAAKYKAQWPRPWRKWNGNYQKIFYDIQTTWGKTIIGCWPNAGKMNAADGTGRSWTKDKVKAIRRSIKEEPET